MKKIKKYADGGMAGVAPPGPQPYAPRMQSSGSNMGLTGIRDAASDLIGTAQNVSQMSQSLVGGGGGGGISDMGLTGDLNRASAARTPMEGPVGALASLGVGFKKGGKVSSASKRADGIAQRGKTRGRMV